MVVNFAGVEMLQWGQFPGYQVEVTGDAELKEKSAVSALLVGTTSSSSTLLAAGFQNILFQKQKNLLTHSSASKVVDIALPFITKSNPYIPNRILFIQPSVII